VRSKYTDQLRLCPGKTLAFLGGAGAYGDGGEGEGRVIGGGGGMGGAEAEEKKRGVSPTYGRWRSKCSDWGLTKRRRKMQQKGMEGTIEYLKVYDTCCLRRKDAYRKDGRIAGFERCG